MVILFETEWCVELSWQMLNAKKYCQRRRSGCAVALEHVAALSAKPVVRLEQHPLLERSSKLAAHSHQRIAEHHVGFVPVVHQRVPKRIPRCPPGSKPERLLPPPFDDRRGTPRHHPTRLRELVIPHNAKPSIYHILVLLLCRVANI